MMCCLLLIMYVLRLWQASLSPYSLIFFSIFSSLSFLVIPTLSSNILCIIELRVEIEIQLQLNSVRVRKKGRENSWLAVGYRNNFHFMLSLRQDRVFLPLSWISIFGIQLSESNLSRSFTCHPSQIFIRLKFEFKSTRIKHKIWWGRHRY